MSTINVAELIPAHPAHHTQPVAAPPEHLGMYRVDLGQDDSGRPLTTVTLQEERYEDAYVYVWTEDGEQRSSADDSDQVPATVPEADLEALEQFAVAVHRNYEQLLAAAVWNLLGNAAFIAEIESLATRRRAD